MPRPLAILGTATRSPRAPRHSLAVHALHFPRGIPEITFPGPRLENFDTRDPENLGFLTYGNHLIMSSEKSSAKNISVAADRGPVVRPQRGSRRNVPECNCCSIFSCAFEKTTTSRIPGDTRASKSDPNLILYRIPKLETWWMLKQARCHPGTGRNCHGVGCCRPSRRPAVHSEPTPCPDLEGFRIKNTATDVKSRCIPIRKCDLGLAKLPPSHLKFSRN